MTFTEVLSKDKGSFTVSEPGKHIFYMHNYSGTLTLDIKTEDAEVFIFGTYIGRGNEKFNVNTIQHHEVGNSISDLYIKGIFFDEAKFVYEGLIRIDKQAQLSNAYQKNQNIIMSDGVFVDSRPFLEILANDVRCTHGSTTGKLSKDQMLYLQTRSLEPNLAKRVLLKGFMQDVFDKMHELGCSDSIESIESKCLASLEH